MIYRIPKKIGNLMYISKSSSIVIDTNVLLWNFYGNISYSSAYQKNIYQPLLSSIVTKGCKIYTTTINIFEVFNMIEKNEYKIYLSNNNLDENQFNLKQYRQLSYERERIKSTCNLILKQISQCINVVDISIKNENIEEFNNNFTSHKYDIFDFTLLKFAEENNINYILTDDKDFSTGSYLIDKVNIITANKFLV